MKIMRLFFILLVTGLVLMNADHAARGVVKSTGTAVEGKVDSGVSTGLDDFLQDELGLDSAADNSSPLTSVFEGNWKGTIRIAATEELLRNSEPLILNLHNVDEELKGTGMYGDLIFDISGVVQKGVFVFDLPADPDDPGCEGWQMPATVSLDDSLSVLSFSARGDLCGKEEGAGRVTMLGELTKQPITRSDLEKVIHQKGVFVAVGADGAILTSPDGVKWHRQTSVATILDIAYGDGFFVAVGVGGRIIVSEDGVNWSRRESGTSVTLTCIVYGQNRFVVGGRLGKVLSSVNGITWQRQDIEATISLQDIAFGAEKFVAIAEGGRILLSADGLVWREQNIDKVRFYSDAYFAITYADDRFVVVGSSSRSYVSPVLVSRNGTHWEKYNSNLFQPLIDITYGAGQFVAVGYNGAITTSRDGSLWDARVLGTNDFKGVAYGDGKFVVVGDSSTVLSSTDSLSWPLPSSGTSNSLPAAAFGDGTFAVGGNEGTILTSTDGYSWIYRTTGVTDDFRFIIYGNGRFVALAQDKMVTSADATGSGWSYKSSRVVGYLSSMAYGNGMFIGVGSSGLVLKSTDGVTWGRQVSGTTRHLNHVIFRNNEFLAIGQGAILASTNGIAWKEYDSNLPEFLKSVVVGDGILVGVGDYGSLFVSKDGAARTWERIYTGSSNQLRDLAYGDGKYIAVGDYGAVLVSRDGQSWVQQPAITSNPLYSITFGDQKFVVAGYLGTLLVSTDGTSWAQQTSASEITIDDTLPNL